ncbi:zwei Ig domain protein zig-8-like [Eriocheir sinensis]|uniref:zwei Ig domain protein zig-8-like n=1 Tax=Eriocheir sinensis TaxID=95602 RepID=UPI0021C90730|nr:zwei Ig domain protein zig-8-like [Eriocheir sinensis]
MASFPLILSLLTALAASVRGEGLIPPPPLVTDQPYFDPSMSTTLTAHVGRRAELHCRVHSIGNRTVSWIRGRDLRILTVGRYTYTTDLRYEALHQAGTNQWTLRITSAQPRDQGNYECQISTKPIKAFTVYLKVLEPRGEILGSPDLYVQKASMINLTCILHDLPEPPEYVLWYHENKSISYSSSRGGVSMVVVKGPTTTSHLLITSATEEDGGLYTCAPAGLFPTHIRVYVLDAEDAAATLKNTSVSRSHPPPPPEGRLPPPASAAAATTTAAATTLGSVTSGGGGCVLSPPSPLPLVLAFTLARILTFVWVEVT